MAVGELRNQEVAVAGAGLGATVGVQSQHTDGDRAAGDLGELVNVIDLVLIPGELDVTRVARRGLGRPGDQSGWPPTRACARCVTRVAAQRKPDKPVAIPGLGWVDTAVSVIRSATAIRWRRSEVAIARVHTGGEAVVVGDPGEQDA